ncbi:MAG: hypothetical protein R3D55_10050 [Chloroflexota bacterium]
MTISDECGAGPMLSLGEVHFAYLWQRSSYAERVVLTAVARRHEQRRHHQPGRYWGVSEPFGVQLPPAEITAALHRLVEREILRDLNDGANTLYELKIGLVGLWATKHKSLSRLHTMELNGSATSKPKLPTRR